MSIQQSSHKWMTVNNIYIPEGDMDLSFIPVKNCTIHAGYFNGHSMLCDNVQPYDDRGYQIVDWILKTIWYARTMEHLLELTRHTSTHLQVDSALQNVLSSLRILARRPDGPRSLTTTWDLTMCPSSRKSPWENSRRYLLPRLGPDGRQRAWTGRLSERK